MQGLKIYVIEDQRSLRSLLFILWKLSLSDEYLRSSDAWRILQRTEKEIEWRENDEARKRIFASISNRKASLYPAYIRPEVL